MELDDWFCAQNCHAPHLARDLAKVVAGVLTLNMSHKIELLTEQQVATLFLALICIKRANTDDRI